MNNDEIIRVQTYLRLKFQNDVLTLKRGAKRRYGRSVYGG